MMIKQSIEGASVDIIGANSLPDVADGVVSADEAGSTRNEIPGRRSRTITDKGRSIRLSTLKERREKINARLQKNSNTIEDLLFSTRDVVAVDK